MRAVLMLTVLTLAAPVRPEKNVAKPKPLQEELQGQWSLVKRVAGGKEEIVTSDEGVVITGETLQGRNSEGKMEEPPMRYRLDTGANPVAMDLTVPRGDNLNIKAIVRLDGDSLAICFTLGEARPLDFVSPPGSNVFLLHLKRVRK